jgi:hypothetical protein
MLGLSPLWQVSDAKVKMPAIWGKKSARTCWNALVASEGLNARSLDVSELLRRGVLAPGSRTRGVISWHGPAGEDVASVSYDADMSRAGEGRLRLRFSTFNMETCDRRQIDQLVALTVTRPGFGGERWWFVDDGRRVARLCLLPGGDQFRSRRAYARGAAQRRMDRTRRGHRGDIAV